MCHHKACFGPQCQKLVFLIEYFYKEHFTWPQLAVVSTILSNCLRLCCDGKSSSLILLQYLSSLTHLKYNMMCGGTYKHAEQVQLNKDCTEVNYSHIQISQFAE